MSKSFSVSEVAKHKTDGDAWVIVEGQVFDVSTFAKDHPGGKNILIRNCGKDSTKQFQKYHNDKILAKYMKLKIGDAQEDSKL